MEGKVISYRRGRHTQNTNQVLIRVEGEREKLMGKEVIWTSKAGKQIKGTVSAPHGNKNVIRAIFEKGLPGQAAGTKVEIK